MFHYGIVSFGIVIIYVPSREDEDLLTSQLFSTSTNTTKCEHYWNVYLIDLNMAT